VLYNISLFQLITNPKNTISGFRNLLGRGYDDPVTQEEIKHVPFKVEKKPDETVGIRVMYNKCVL